MMEMTTRMGLIRKKFALAASLTAIVVGLGTGVAFAEAENDTDGINPFGTPVTATQTTSIVFRGTIDGFSDTVTCKGSSISGTIPPFGLGPFNINNPSFTNCTDSLGGTDTVTTNSTNGHWQLTFIDAPNDENETEPNTGDELELTIPKAGGTLTLGFVPDCMMPFAPGRSFDIVDRYDDRSKWTISNVIFPVGDGKACTGISFAISGTYNFSPGFHDSG